MPDCTAAIENWLSNLSAAEFRALVARTRPPDEPITLPCNEPQPQKRENPMPDNDDEAAQAARNYLAALSDEDRRAFLDGLRTNRVPESGGIQRGRDLYRQRHDPKWIQTGPGHEHIIST